MFASLKSYLRFQKIKNKNNLIILGEGSLKNLLIDFAKSNKILDKIEFRGYVKDPSCFYKKSDLLIMTSFFEGILNSVLEAMSCGLLCLVSSSFATSINFYKENSELVYKENDVFNFVEKITYFYDNFEQRKYLGNESKKFIKSNNQISKKKWKSIFNI
jgi:glycosyltransferase involved in cell wall biosynthesis